MHLRTLLFVSFPASVLLSMPGIAVTPATEYVSDVAALRTLFATSLSGGLPAAELLPLQTELTAIDTNAFLGVPVVVLDPSGARARIASLRHRTNTLYSLDLATSRDTALAARLTLTRALGTVSTEQSHQLRDDLAAASTINDYSSLAAAWSLDALLVPLDRSLATRQATLVALIAQATSLSLSTTATAPNADLTTYFTSTPAMRYSAAPALVLLADTTITHLHSLIDAEVAARAAAQAAAEAAQAAAAAKAAAEAAAAAYALAHPPGLYLTLNGSYDDCTGKALVPPGLSRNHCIASLWLIAHKWSTGASFFSLHIGSHIYYQGRTYTVFNIFVADPKNEYYGPNGLATENSPMRLETCYTDSGSLHLIIQAR